MEICSEKARELRDEYVNGSVEILAPELMPYEVLNALKYTGLFNLNELVMVAKSLSLYGFRLYSLVGELAEITAKLAVKNNITIYDASYVALAEKLKAKFYTSDEKLIEKVKSDCVVHISSF